MKKNLWLLGGLVAMAFSACTNEETLSNDHTLAPGKKVQVTAYAPGDGAESRIAFNEDGDDISLSWNEQESFSVIRNGENQTFSKNTQGNIFNGDWPDAQGTGPYYAVYPAITTATDYTAVPYDLSSQTGVLDGSNPYMYATSTDGAEFHFHHTTALLKATFSNTDWTADTRIKQVKVLLPNDKAKGNINLNGGALTGTDGYNLITINYETPVAVDATTKAYQAYIYLPPMDADNKTLVFMVTTGDEKTYTATLAGDNTKDIEAGKVYNATVTLSEMNYLMFIADGGGQSLTMSNAVTGLKYSTNGTDWKDLPDTPINFSNNRILLLRGITNNGTLGENIIFGNSVKVACLGDIRTLVDYENYSTIQDSGNFSYLFWKCTSLTTAPKLPAETLEESCYWGMFQYCSSLTAAPELPAETLANKCYVNMFLDCTSLATAPALPATTLAESCYSSMFSGCISLATAPALPAETLAEKCDTGMFSGCTSLTTAPALQATNLAEYCYQSMFKGCNLLATAPALPAAELAELCYSFMFQNCISLTAAPALPAETLAGYCYGNMFEGCTSLTTAPTLPATTLAQGCYYAMFYNCTKLNNVTMLATDIPANSCLNYWLNGVAATGTFIKASSMTSLPSGANGIPSGWTVIDNE